MTSAMWGIVIGMALIVGFSLHRSRSGRIEAIATSSRIFEEPPASTSAL